MSHHKTSAFSGASVALGLVLALGATQGYGQDCQSGTGPVAGQATENALGTAAAATPNVCSFNPTVNAAAKTNIKNVLLMDWSNGGHDKSHTQKHMYRLARKYGFKLTRSQSNTYITPAILDSVDLIVFNNGDQDPISNATPLAAVRDFVETKGKGIMAVHAALAFIPCPSEDVTVASLTTCRWFLRAYRTQFNVHLNHTSTNAIRVYADTVRAGTIPPNATGADIIPASVNHGPTDSSLVNIFASLPSLPASQQLPVNGGTGPDAASRLIWDGMWDEWYNYRNHPRRAPTGEYGGVHWGPVKVLLSIDESHSSYPNTLGCSGSSPCKTGDRPVSWTRVIGNAGLAAYNNAGHGNVYARSRTPTGGTATVDSMWEIYSWRLLKYLARDYVGCMNPASPNYNDQASVRSITPVDSTPGSAVYRKGDFASCPAPSAVWKHPKGVGKIEGVKAVSSGIRIPLPGAGTYDLLVARPNGRVVDTRSVAGGNGVTAEVKDLQKGYYVVRLTGADNKLSVARVLVQ